VKPIFRVILIAPGPNRLAVILRVRQLLGLSLAEARERVDGGEVILAEGDYMERRLHDLRQDMESLGGIAVLR
jgi:ribosomal protein L7/L12